MRNGRFITLEGGEGVGKSTLAAALKSALEARGLTVLVTREPGGTPGAELLRNAILNPPESVVQWQPLTEALLFYAARTDHLAKLIRPALNAGSWVICDRFSDSTRAYQAAAGGLLSASVDTLERMCVGEYGPDLTLVLDMSLEAAHGRRKSRGAADDAIEARGEEYHERVRQAFLEIARHEPRRCVVIDAAQSAADVAHLALGAIDQRLGGA